MSTWSQQDRKERAKEIAAAWQRRLETAGETGRERLGGTFSTAEVELLIDGLMAVAAGLTDDVVEWPVPAIAR